MNRPYELMYIMDARLDEASQTKIKDRIKETIQGIGGTIEKSEVWAARKRLAYPIQKCKEGTYIMTNFEADSGNLKELTRVMNITEGLLRHIVIRRDES